MRPRHLLPVIAVFLLMTAAVSANEILHMTNGTTMVIRAHEIHGTMIHVDLGDNAKMAFPAGQVERISKAGRNVYVQPSYRGKEGDRGSTGKIFTSGIQIDSEISSRFPQQGYAPDRSKREGYKGKDAAGKALDKLLEQQAGGEDLPVGYRPFADNPNKAARGMTATGNMSAYQNALSRDGRRGSGVTPSGKTIIPPPRARGGSPRTDVTGIKKEVNPAWMAIRDGKTQTSKDPAASPPAEAPKTDQTGAGGE